MDMSEYLKSKGILAAMWCVDSETGDECLCELYTSKVIAKRKDGKILYPGVDYETSKEA